MLQRHAQHSVDYEGLQPANDHDQSIQYNYEARQQIVQQSRAILRAEQAQAE
jgi:hypothetical protein